MNIEQLGLQFLWTFCAVIARFGPILWFAPPFRSKAIPAQLRILLTLGLSVLFTPVAMPTALPKPDNPLSLALGISGELLLGTFFASMFALTLLSLKIAGQTIGNFSGLGGLISVSVGSDEELSSPISSLFTWIALAILLVVGGHRLIIECCLESLTSQPIGSVQIETMWLIEFQRLLSHSFVLGLKASTTISAVLVLTNISLGLLARAMPQINVFSVGFSVNTLSMLTVLCLTVGGIGKLYQMELGEFIAGCQRVVNPDP